jgi:hypothetical protein
MVHESENQDHSQESDHAQGDSSAQAVRTCGQCGKGIDHMDARAKFCSHNCRSSFSSKNSRMRSATQSDALPKEQREQKESSHKGMQVALTGLPAHASYIIAHQQKEIDRWERQFNEEKSEHKRTKEKYKDLKEEIQNERHATELKGLENARPGALDQLKGMIEVIPEEVRGPMFSFLFNKIVPSANLGGVQVSENQQWAQIQSWYAQLPEDQQQKIYEILNGLAMSNPQTFDLRLTQIGNLLKVAVPHNRAM